MQAAYMKDIDDIVFKTAERASLLPDEVRIRVDACGICGTDVTAALGEGQDYKAFGHEVAGTVLEIGSNIPNVRVGQTVVLESSSACGRCSNCRNARQDLCSDVQSFWPKPPYGFAEEMVVPAICAVPYEGIPAEHACLAEPLGVAIDMVQLAQIEVGSCVLVSGLGPIGLMAIRLARLAGAEFIYACDVSAAVKRLELARQFGADRLIAVDKTPLTEGLLDHCPDRLLVSSPPSTLPTMIEIARSAAIISYIGIEYGPGADVTFDANVFHFKKLQLRGSFASPALYTPKAVHLLQTGQVNPDPLVSHIFSLDQLSQAMHVAAEETSSCVKVVVKPALKASQGRIQESSTQPMRQSRSRLTKIK